jgi:magnesium-transporting ATPase (P-type)
MTDMGSELRNFKSDLEQLDASVRSYVKSDASTKELIETVTNVKDRLGEVENRIEAAEQAAATYDREFLERKNGMPSTFVKDRIYTLQDFSFFFFFVSYLIFALAISLTVEQKIQTLTTFFIVGIVIMLTIVRFA